MRPSISFLFFGLLIASTGCNRQTSSTESLNPSIPQSPSNAGAFELIHDFGLVKPGQKLSHDFLVSNPTAKDWKLVNIAQSCTCSVASVSSTIVKAGKSEVFKFDYQAPTGSADERRWVIVTIDDPDVKEFKLTITAWVRPIMASSVSTLNFGNVPDRGDVVQTLELGNFGSEDWNGVDLIDPPSWLQVERVEKVKRPWKGISPRETWSLDLRITNASLKAGAYRQEALFRSKTKASATVWVEFVSGSVVQVRPSLLMLGKVERSKIVEATTLLSFFSGSAPCASEMVKVSSTGVKLTKHEIIALKPDLWKLVVRLEPIGKPGDFIDGVMSVSFPGSRQTEISIPIRSQIR